MFYSRNCGAEFVKSAYAQDVKLLSGVAHWGETSRVENLRRELGTTRVRRDTRGFSVL